MRGSATSTHHALTRNNQGIQRPVLTLHLQPFELQVKGENMSLASLVVPCPSVVCWSVAEVALPRTYEEDYFLTEKGPQMRCAASVGLKKLRCAALRCKLRLPSTSAAACNCPIMPHECLSAVSISHDGAVTFVFELRFWWLFATATNSDANTINSDANTISRNRNVASCFKKFVNCSNTDHLDSMLRELFVFVQTGLAEDFTFTFSVLKLGRQALLPWKM